jgi:polyhydroxybutyrate depolymerase
MLSRRTLLGIISSLLLLATLFAARNRHTRAEDLLKDHQRCSVETQQGTREYLLFAPPQTSSNDPRPLVIMLHGFGGSGANAAKETGWSEKATQKNLIVAYGEATRPNRATAPHFRKNPQAWNDGSGRFHAATEKIDDVAYVKTLIEHVSQNHNIDPNRIFVTGFSNGASMAFRVGAELADQVAAIAPVSGTCWLEKPKPTKSISLCYITGTEDSLNPIEGGFPKLALGGKEQGGASKPPVQTFIERWAQALKCTSTPEQITIAPGVQQRIYRRDPNIATESPVIHYVTIEGLGHHWPGGVSLVPNILVGKPSKKLIATDLIWDFFDVHSPHER